MYNVAEFPAELKQKFTVTISTVLCPLFFFLTYWNLISPKHFAKFICSEINSHLLIVTSSHHLLSHFSLSCLYSLWHSFPTTSLEMFQSIGPHCTEIGRSPPTQDYSFSVFFSDLFLISVNDRHQGGVLDFFLFSPLTIMVSETASAKMPPRGTIAWPRSGVFDVPEFLLDIFTSVLHHFVKHKSQSWVYQIIPTTWLPYSCK